MLQAKREGMSERDALLKNGGCAILVHSSPHRFYKYRQKSFLTGVTSQTPEAAVIKWLHGRVSDLFLK